MSKVKLFMYFGLIFCLGALFGSVMELHGKSIVSSAEAAKIESGWKALEVSGTNVSVRCYVLLRPDNTIQNVNGFSCASI